jgi:integrase
LKSSRLVEIASLRWGQNSDRTTLGKLVDSWAALHLKSKRPRYTAESAHAIKRVFKQHLDKPGASLTRKSVIAMTDGLIKDGKPVMAARAGAYLGSLYSWAKKRGTVDDNPFIGLPRVSRPSRARVLTDDELRAVWQATAESGAFNAIVRVLILTGQRRNEVAGLPWSELTPDGKTWSLPAERAKNNTAHLVPLSVQAQAVIEAQPRLNDSPFVFTDNKGQTFRGFWRAKRLLDRACGVKGWVLHDLRRTVATGLQKLGVRLEVTEAARVPRRA